MIDLMITIFVVVGMVCASLAIMSAIGYGLFAAYAIVKENYNRVWQGK